jgi:hypothetical protein
MAQNFVVALLVGGCFVYALWTMGPKAPRSRLAAALLKWPLPMLLQIPLAAAATAARKAGGCGGCNGCAGAAPAKKPLAQHALVPADKPVFQPLTFVRGNYAKKISR